MKRADAARAALDRMSETNCEDEYLDALDDLHDALGALGKAENALLVIARAQSYQEAVQVAQETLADMQPAQHGPYVPGGTR